MRENPVILIAPDSFKGSLSAADATAALDRGAREVLPETATVLAFPMADGGEGSLNAILAAWQQPAHSATTVDALGRQRTANYGLSPAGDHAIIEAAQANGLPHVADVPLRPLRASSYGVGLLAVRALARGVRKVTLFLGGSASTDGGAGFLRALGARFLDVYGNELPDGGGALASLTTIDLGGLIPGVFETHWRIAVDVTNPLTGDQGAARVFGPQKGADESDITALEAGLTRLARVLAATAQATHHGHSATSLTALPGLGAAGGLATVLVALCDAKLLAGAELVANSIGLDEAISSADVVLSGEGSLDQQSLDGKVVDYLRSAKKPTTWLAVIAARIELTPAQTKAAGIDLVLPLGSGLESRSELYQYAAALLEARGAHAIAEWLEQRDSHD